MFKKLLLIILLFIPKAYSQVTYYISSDGDDRNSGTSPELPWATLKELTRGNIYRFKRGDTFRFPIPKSKSEIDKRIEIASYGTGRKPVFDFFKTIEKKKWTLVGKNIWRACVNQDSLKDISKAEINNIGFIKWQGYILGNKFQNINNLSANWDFYSNEGCLYIYLDKDPSLERIQVSVNITGINLSSNLNISDIEIIGAGGHAINGANLNSVILKNIDISQIGGCYLAGYKDGNVRYGNGIQFFNGCNNCHVENCTVSQVYDAAFTMQGDIPQILFSNTVFKNNLSRDNGQTFEIWARGGGVGFLDCKFINNKCYNAGFGWSNIVRPDKGTGVHILSYALEISKCDILFENNIFYNAKDGLYFFLDYQNAPRFTSRNNKISLKYSTPIRSLSSKSSEKKMLGLTGFSVFTHVTGKEQGSQFKTIP